MNEEANSPLDLEVLKKIVIYHQIQITDPKDYKNLKTTINKISNKETKQLYYLAIGPELFFDVAKKH